ncbi:hypothetical protein, partial [Salmonella enterica]|nr:hypothetical protein [Salmonella enterica]
YRDGSAEQVNPAMLGQRLGAAGAALGGRGVRLQHLRRTALGSDVIKADRKLDRAEAETLMRQIAANPNVEYVEPDRLMKPVLTPNDTSYNQ